MTEYSENDGLNKVLKKVMEDKSKHELDALREQELKVDAVLKSKTNKEGENQPCGGPPANVVKVSGMWSLYTDARYILVVDNYFFTHADDNTVEGMVFNALQGIDIKVVKGEIKLAKRRPDIEVFAATVVHYGPILEPLIALKEILANGTKRFISKVVTGTLEEPATPTDAGALHSEAAVDSQATEAPPAKRRGGRKA